MPGTPSTNRFSLAFVTGRSGLDVPFAEEIRKMLPEVEVAVCSIATHVMEDVLEEPAVAGADLVFLMVTNLRSRALAGGEGPTAQYCEFVRRLRERTSGVIFCAFIHNRDLPGDFPARMTEAGADFAVEAPFKMTALEPAVRIAHMSSRGAGTVVADRETADRRFSAAYITVIGSLGAHLTAIIQRTLPKLEVADYLLQYGEMSVLLTEPVLAEVDLIFINFTSLRSSLPLCLNRTVGDESVQQRFDFLRRLRTKTRATIVVGSSLAVAPVVEFFRELRAAGADFAFPLPFENKAFVPAIRQALSRKCGSEFHQPRMSVAFASSSTGVETSVLAIIRRTLPGVEVTEFLLDTGRMPALLTEPMLTEVDLVFVNLTALQSEPPPPGGTPSREDWAQQRCDFIHRLRSRTQATIIALSTMQVGPRDGFLARLREAGADFALYLPFKVAELAPAIHSACTRR